MFFLAQNADLFPEHIIMSVILCSVSLAHLHFPLLKVRGVSKKGLQLSGSVYQHNKINRQMAHLGHGHLHAQTMLSPALQYLADLYRPTPDNQQAEKRSHINFNAITCINLHEVQLSFLTAQLTSHTFHKAQLHVWGAVCKLNNCYGKS